MSSQEKVPPRTQAAARQAVAQGEVPQKFFPLLLYIAWATVKAFFTKFPMMLIWMALLGILGWGLHTFLLAAINQGFDATSPIADILNIHNNGIAATIIWTVGSGLLFSLIGQKFFAKGEKPPKQPPLGETFREAGGLALPGMVAVAGVSLIIGIAAGGWASVALAIGIAGTMLSAGGSTVGLLVSSAWSSTYGRQQNIKAKKFSMSTGKVAMVGGIAAFILSFFMPWWGKIMLGLALLVLAFYLANGRSKPAAAMFLAIILTAIFAGIAAQLSNVLPVFATDGGLNEAGNNWITWWGSEGAEQARNAGVAPGIGAAIAAPLAVAIQVAGNTLQQLPGVAGGAGGGGGSGADGGEQMVDEDGNPMLNWEPDKYAEGEKGKVWYYDKWVTRDQARQEIADNLANRAKYRQQIDATAAKNLQDFRADAAAQQQRDRIEAANTIAAAEKARSAAAQARLDRLNALLTPTPAAPAPAAPAPVPPPQQVYTVGGREVYGRTETAADDPAPAAPPPAPPPAPAPAPAPATAPAPKPAPAAPAPAPHAPAAPAAPPPQQVYTPSGRDGVPGTGANVPAPTAPGIAAGTAHIEPAPATPAPTPKPAPKPAAPAPAPTPAAPKPPAPAPAAPAPAAPEPPPNDPFNEHTIDGVIVDRPWN